MRLEENKISQYTCRLILRLSSHSYRDTVLGQKGSSDALFTPKVPIFTTLSHCAMSMRISKNLSLHKQTCRQCEASYRMLKYYQLMEKWSFKYLVSVVIYLFVWGLIQNLSHFYTCWRNHEQQTQLWFLTLVLAEIPINSDSLADRKISSIFI